MQNEFEEFEVSSSFHMSDSTSNMERYNDIDEMDERPIQVERQGHQHQNNIEGQGHQDEQDPLNPFAKKQRKMTSKAWEDCDLEILPDGTKVARCKHCKKELSLPSTGTTTHLNRHVATCLQKKLAQKNQTILNFQPVQSEMEAPILTSGKYDHAKQREVIAQWILTQQKPFNVVEDESFTRMFRANLPSYEKISRIQIKGDCMTIYDIEKAKLKNLLTTISKVSLTTDLWKSKVQKSSYMCVTGHFVDRDWKLHKRVLSFMPLPPPHGGVEISDALRNCIRDWGIEDKVFSISVDNASNNDSAIKLARMFSSSRGLPLEGKLFHVRCCAHILNLIVQDGLSEIKPIIAAVRDTISYLNGSEARLNRFSEIVRQMKLPANKLIMECKHRWNSTYDMLVSAAKVKGVFPAFAELDQEYKFCPNAEDWKKAEQVMNILQVFYEATQVISASDYPTSNKFLVVIWRVKEVLKERPENEEGFLRAMLQNMRSKFNKYWGECNLLMSIASVLDPRYKMLLVQFSFSHIYDGEEAESNIKIVRDSVQALYDDYKAMSDSRSRRDNSMTSQNSGSTRFEVLKTDFLSSGLSRFNEYVDSTQRGKTSKSELDVYLDEPVYVINDDSSQFDALDWWKANETRYPTLSKIARDVRAVYFGFWYAANEDVMQLFMLVLRDRCAQT